MLYQTTKWVVAALRSISRATPNHQISWRVTCSSISRAGLATHMLECDRARLNTSDAIKAVRLTTSTCALPNKEVGRCSAQEYLPSYAKSPNQQTRYMFEYIKSRIDNTHARERIEHDSQPFRRYQSGDVNRRPISSKIKPNRPVTTSILALSYNETYWTTTHTQLPGTRPEHDAGVFTGCWSVESTRKTNSKTTTKTSDENERVSFCSPHPLISANFSNCRMGVR